MSYVSIEVQKQGCTVIGASLFCRYLICKITSQS